MVPGLFGGGGFPGIEGACGQADGARQEPVGGAVEGEIGGVTAAGVGVAQVGGGVAGGGLPANDAVGRVAGVGNVGGVGAGGAHPGVAVGAVPGQRGGGTGLGVLGGVAVGVVLHPGHDCGAGGGQEPVRCV